MCIIWDSALLGLMLCNNKLTFCMQSLCNEDGIFIAVIVQSIPNSSLWGGYSIKSTPTITVITFLISLNTHTPTVTGSCTTL